MFFNSNVVPFYVEEFGGRDVRFFECGSPSGWESFGRGDVMFFRMSESFWVGEFRLGRRDFF